MVVVVMFTQMKMNEKERNQYLDRLVKSVDALLPEYTLFTLCIGVITDKQLGSYTTTVCGNAGPEIGEQLLRETLEDMEIYRRIQLEKN